MKTLLSAALVVLLITAGTLTGSTPADAAFGFVEKGVSVDTPGIISGLWHGLVAPYALILGIFNTSIGMYAHPNAGWVYDVGFLIGAGGSLPIGWILAIISLVLLVL